MTAGPMEPYREATPAGVGRPLDDADLAATVRASMWDPVYPVLEPLGRA